MISFATLIVAVLSEKK
ncbi:hypothetical protein [Virgibacillus halodenitrificans]